MHFDVIDTENLIKALNKKVEYNLLNLGENRTTEVDTVLLKRLLDNYLSNDKCNLFDINEDLEYIKTIENNLDGSNDIKLISYFCKTRSDSMLSMVINEINMLLSSLLSIDGNTMSNTIIDKLAEVIDIKIKQMIKHNVDNNEYYHKIFRISKISDSELESIRFKFCNDEGIVYVIFDMEDGALCVTINLYHVLLLLK